MKKITLLLLLIMLYPMCNYAQCLSAPNGQYPTGSAFILNTCDSSSKNTIVFDGWAGEYSLIAVNAGETYEFNSSISTDFITISDDTGTSVFASGVTPITWTSGFTGDIRFYTHINSGCGDQSFGRERYVICGSGLLSNKEFYFDDFNYYPNPVESALSLNSKDIVDEIVIFNMIGQEVFKGFKNKKTGLIDLSYLSKGAYFMKVSINGSSQNLKVLKN